MCCKGGIVTWAEVRDRTIITGSGHGLSSGRRTEIADACVLDVLAEQLIRGYVEWASTNCDSTIEERGDTALQKAGRHCRVGTLCDLHVTYVHFSREEPYVVERATG